MKIIMFRQIRLISKFTIIESLRNRLLWLSLILVAISFALVEFIGDLAITEHRITQVAILAAFLRLSAVVVVTLFVVSSTVRELQDKTLEMILAMPIHRSSYYFGKFAGFVVVALVMATLYSLLLLLYAQPDQVLIWGISLALELMLVVALGLVMLFTFKQIPSALTGVFVFYAAARTIVSIYLMSSNPIVPHVSLGQKFIDGFVNVLTWVLPNLQAFTRTDWLVYNTGQWSALLPLLMQTLIFLALLSSVALFDFYRKNF
jgi:ABC-type Na+ efflux pump permease subunit